MGPKEEIPHEVLPRHLPELGCYPPNEAGIQVHRRWLAPGPVPIPT
jgi:hypothetical protein